MIIVKYVNTCKIALTKIKGNRIFFKVIINMSSQVDDIKAAHKLANQLNLRAILQRTGRAKPFCAQ